MSTGTTARLATAVPTRWLPLALFCGSSRMVAHASAVMYPGAVPSVIATLTSTADAPAAPVVTAARWESVGLPGRDGRIHGTLTRTPGPIWLPAANRMSPVAAPASDASTATTPCRSDGSATRR